MEHIRDGHKLDIYLDSLGCHDKVLCPHAEQEFGNHAFADLPECRQWTDGDGSPQGGDSWDKCIVEDWAENVGTALELLPCNISEGFKVVEAPVPFEYWWEHETLHIRPYTGRRNGEVV